MDISDLSNRRSIGASDGEQGHLTGMKATVPVRPLRAARARALRVQNKGYIDGEFLKNTLMTRGDAFRPEEVTELMVRACVPSPPRAPLNIHPFSVGDRTWTLTGMGTVAGWPQGIAADEATGNIYYEDYAETLANDGRLEA